MAFWKKHKPNYSHLVHNYRGCGRYNAAALQEALTTQGGQRGLRSHRESHGGAAVVRSTRQPGQLAVRVYSSNKPVAPCSVHSLCLLAPEGCEQETQDQVCNTITLNLYHAVRL